MSTYYNSNTKNKFTPSESDTPDYIRNFLSHLEKAKFAHRTIYNYYMVLLTLIKWIYLRDHPGAKRSDVIVTDISFDLIRALTEQDILDFLNYCRKRRKNGSASIAPKISALRLFFEYCRKQKLLDVNPTDKIETPKRKSTELQCLTDEEIKSLLTAAGDSESPSRDICIITLFLNTGIRLNELTAINLSDIKNDALVVRESGRKGRTVYLNELCQAALDDWIDDRRECRQIDKTALFISPMRGKRITGRTVEAIISRALERAGMSGKGYSPSTLRHTAALRMYQTGMVDVPDLQAVLGHRSGYMENKYAKADQARIQRALDQLSITQK